MKKAYFTYHGNNIGDDIQTFAIRNFFGEPDCYLDRDSLDSYIEEEIELIANGFMICGKFPPPSNIYPKYISIGIAGAGAGNDHETVMSHYRQQKYIGCRDTHSVNLCKRFGINGVFIGCPTILIGKRFVKKQSEKIKFIDIDPNIFKFKNEKFFYENNIIFETNYYNIGSDVNKRQSLAEKRINSILDSKLIITTRLHVAMPAIGAGIPVIFIDDGIMNFRITAFPKFVKIFSLKEAENIDLYNQEYYLDYEKELHNYQKNVIDSLEYYFNLKTI